MALYPSRVRSNEVLGDQLPLHGVASRKYVIGVSQLPLRALRLKEDIHTFTTKVPSKEPKMAHRCFIPTSRRFGNVIPKLRPERFFKFGRKNYIEIDGLVLLWSERDAASPLSRNASPVRIWRTRHRMSDTSCNRESDKPD
jgi:hypothetical protein